MRVVYCSVIVCESCGSVCRARVLERGAHADWMQVPAVSPVGA